MVSIVSRSEFPEEDDEAENSRPATHHHFKMSGGSDFSEGPGSNARPRGASQAPTEAPPPPSPINYVGATVDGRYLVEKQLGEGGMGVVYLCRHTIIDKRVAMKVLRSDLARNEEVTERFLNEARSASSIHNPHIIDISDFGRLPDGAPYFVMEFLVGTSLADLVESHEVIEPARVGHIALQLCEGLAAAHAAGIIHRDLKPDNIFLVKQGSRDDFVKILDFGIAKATHTATKLTQAGQVFGTPHYMSPEQASGAPVDLRSDVYALGVILYELSAGQLPFDADNFMAILTQHMYKEPPPPSGIDGLAPLVPGLEALILKCLAKSPSERYQSMLELVGDLRLVFSDLLPLAPAQIGMATNTFSTPQQFARPPSSGAALPAAPEANHTRRHLPLYAGIGVVAALSAGILVWNLGSAAEQGSGAVSPLVQQAAEPTTAKNQAALSPSNPSTVAPPLTQVAVAVLPLHAHVFRDEVDLGESPVMVEVGSAPVILQARLSGYDSRSFSVDGSSTKMSVTLSSAKAKPRPISGARNAQPSADRPKKGSSSDGVVNPWD